MRTRFMYLIKSPLRQTFLNLRNVHTEYRSAISLSSLYPESSLNLATPVKPPQNENGKFSGYIPVEKLELSYCRSSGPGGQHVNKVNTKVDLRFHLKSADWLSEETKAQLAEKYQSRLNKDGYFIVRSDKTRSQIYNQADAITILREMIYAIENGTVKEPSQETLQMIRKRKERANMERLAQKRAHSQKKTDRQVPNF